MGRNHPPHHPRHPQNANEPCSLKLKKWL
jgi:hypothetical protein